MSTTKTIAPRKKYDSLMQKRSVGPIFYNPVFRFGRVCALESGNKLSFDQATIFGKYFSNSKNAKGNEEYIKEFEGFCKKNSIEYLLTEKEDKRISEVQYQITPIIRLPIFTIELEGYSFVVRESITVCVGESQSKIWISASIKKYETALNPEQLKAINIALISYTENRFPSLMKFYSEGLRKLNGGLKNEDFKIKPSVSIQINSVELNSDMNQFLFKYSNQDKKSIISKLKRDSALNRGFEFYLDFATQSTGGARLDDFQLFIQNTTPMYEDRDRKSIVPFVIDGTESLERLSLVLSVCDETEKNLPVEYYFTIGEKAKELNKDTRYQNAVMSSFAIMREVGRGF